MKRKTNGLGKYVYTEWLIPILYYMGSLRINEWISEVIIPFAAALLVTSSYHSIDKTQIALDALSEMLPSVVSLLLGFTVLFATLISDKDTESVRMLKQIERKVGDRKLSEFQITNLHITESFYCEIALLLVIFLYLFLKGFNLSVWVECVFLVAYVFFTLHILFGIVRFITKFCFYHLINEK